MTKGEEDTRGVEPREPGKLVGAYGRSLATVGDPDYEGFPTTPAP